MKPYVCGGNEIYVPETSCEDGCVGTRDIEKVYRIIGGEPVTYLYASYNQIKNWIEKGYVVRGLMDITGDNDEVIGKEVDMVIDYRLDANPNYPYTVSTLNEVFYATDADESPMLTIGGN